MDDNTGIFAGAYDDEDVGGQADLNNLEKTMNEPKKVIQALEDPSWIEAMQEELLQFELHKERLVAQGYTEEEGIDYDEFSAPVARIEAIRLFLAYASYMGFIVYQMDVKSAFLYGTSEEEVYVCQPPSFEDPHFPDKVYKVEKALYGLHQPPGFDVDFLSKTINYVPVVVGNQTNGIVGTRDNIVASQAEKKTEPKQNEASDKYGKDEQDSRSEFERLLQQEKQTEHPNSTNSINTVSTPISTSEPSSTYDAPSSPINVAKSSEEHPIERFSLFKNAFTLPDVPNVSPMDDNTGIFAGACDDEDVGGQADLNNLEITMNVCFIPITRINKDHPIELIIGDLQSAPLTRRMSQQNLEEHSLVSWIEAMQEELLQFELQKIWTLVDLPNGKRAIGTKWVFRNKKDERLIVVRNKARLVSQGYTQEEGIDYDEVFALVARIEAIRIFLAYASYMGFIMYQMDMKSAFLYGTIEEEVYVCQPPGFEDPHFPNKVYKVEKALYGLHQPPGFDVDSLSKSINYVPVVEGNQTNGIAGTRDNIDSEEYVGVKPTEVDESEASDKDGKDEQDSRSDTPVSTAEPSSTYDAPSSPINAAKSSEEHLIERFSPFKNAFTLPDVPNVSPMDDNTGIFAGACDDEDVGGQADLNNLEITMNVSFIPTTRINKDHPIELIIGDLHSAPLTRRISQQNLEEHFLIEAMQEELLQFELQKIWTLVDLPNGKRAIGTKWVFRNKKYERLIVVRNKARLVSQGYTQEEGIDYDEMDMRSAFLYATIKEEVYVCQPPGFEDPHFPNKVYKVEKALYSLHQPPGFDVHSLSKSMNYVPVVEGNQTNGIAGTRDNIDSEEYVGVKPTEVDESEASDKDGKDEQDSRSDTAEPSSTYDAPSSPINAAKSSKEHLIEQFSPFKNAFTLLDVPNVSLMDDNTGIFAGAYDDEEKVWILVDLPNGKRSIGTKWVFRNKKDDRGIVVRNKARLVAQGYTQEEGINYDEVFAPVVRIKAIRLFFAYASYMGFIVYQMDVKSAFLYGTIEEEVYVFQPPGFEDPHFPDKVYKVEKALYGLHQPLGFNIDSLSKSMNYVPVVARNQTNGIAGTRDNIVTGKAEKKTEPEQEYILIPICTIDPLISQGPKDSEEDARVKPTEVDESEASDKDGKDEQDSRSEFERLLQQEKQTEHPNNTNSINTISTPVSTAEPSSTYDAPSSPVNAAKTFEEHLIEHFSPFKNVFTLPDVPNVSLMDDNTRIFAGAYDDEDVGGQADLNNLETTMNEPKKVIQALEDPSWIEAKQEELL
ncbi:putative ribonuclease H-like domain-containing protein [Tanacetum coccineum]